MKHKPFERYKNQTEFPLAKMESYKNFQRLQWMRAASEISKHIKQESLAITLNMKHTRVFHNPREVLTNDNILAEKNVRHFINVLQNSLGQELLNCFGLQKVDRRFHCHGIIEKPKCYKRSMFKNLILGVWIQTDWGTLGKDSRDFSITTVNDAQGWIGYSTRVNTSIERFIPTNGKSWISVGI